MTSTAVISLNDLRLALHIIIDHIIQTQGHDKVDVKPNYYWDIDAQDRYDLSVKPSELTIGDFQEAIDVITSVRGGAMPPLANHLEQVAPLIRAIGEVTSNLLSRKGG